MISKKLPPIPETIYVVFDTCNGDHLTKRYAWWFATRKEAVAKKKQLNSNPKWVDVIGPFKFSTAPKEITKHVPRKDKYWIPYGKSMWVLAWKYTEKELAEFAGSPHTNLNHITWYNREKDAISWGKWRSKKPHPQNFYAPMKYYSTK